MINWACLKFIKQTACIIVCQEYSPLAAPMFWIVIEEIGEISERLIRAWIGIRVVWIWEPESEDGEAEVAIEICIRN